MKTIRKINKPKTFIIAMLILTFITRLIGLNIIPSGINQDEAMGALDALALSQYATDRFGTFLPVHFTAWGYSQMSVLLSYCMIPFIKILGFNIISIRLPLALISSFSILVIYKISKQYVPLKVAYLIMSLTIINPWHIMQSRWALDCNLFPHIFLFAFYLLLKGLEKTKYLYLSMLFFALTFYSYGVAIYTVPVFLFFFAGFCIWKKQISFPKIIICIIIFMSVALPEIITMGINALHLKTIETPFFTMPYFEESMRNSDILFLNFSFEQLFKNCKHLITQAFLQYPDHLFNSLPAFGPLYPISTPFIFIGMVSFIKQLFYSQNIKQHTKDIALLGFLLTGIWTGITTLEVNINRINIIFYPLIIFCGYGLYSTYLLIKNTTYQVLLLRLCISSYIFSFIAFVFLYLTHFSEEIKVYFNVDFLNIIHIADQLEDYDTLLITSNMDWQFNSKMSEILTQYSCLIDAQYIQGNTNFHRNTEYLPYHERYLYLTYDVYPYQTIDTLYILHISELSTFPYTYEIIIENPKYVGITVY